jgi:hypothetical protein
MLEAARRIESPYETEARYSTKGAMSWVGYKVHLTEGCDYKDLPNLITSVSTTVASDTDVKQLCAIQEGLSRSGLLPGEQLADAAYVGGSNPVSSHARQIDLVGLPYRDNTWQAKAKEGFDVASFRVDWGKKAVACPRRRESIRWSETETARGRSMSPVKFRASEFVHPSALHARAVRRARGPRTSPAGSPCSPKKSTKPSRRPEGVKKRRSSPPSTRSGR